MIETETVDRQVEFPSNGMTKPNRGLRALAGTLYPVALLASISIWLLALRAPLWLDETLSYWQVSGGFRKIWTRSALMPSSIGYLYSLWAAKSILGSSELALKVPSLVALLLAVYFLFRMVRELFGRDTAYLTCIFFAIEGNVIFAATDARPYAFALLATTLAGFSFVRWMEGGQVRQAALFGGAASMVLYFHYLYACVLPAFAIYYMIARWRFLRRDARQLAVMIGTFVLCSLPLVYRILSLYQTRQTHIVQEMRHPGLVVLNTLVPRQTLIGFLMVAFIAAMARRITLPEKADWRKLLMGPLLALAPAGVLVTVSTVTPAHLLIPRYLTAAAPGSALLWALLTRRVDSRWLRQSFCVFLVLVTVVEFYRSPARRKHELSFKGAHEVVNELEKQEQAPVLVCSAFIESNYEPMPKDQNEENPLLSQVDYYPIHASVKMLPITLSDQTVRLAGPIIADIANTHGRFLVVVAPDSYPVLQWLSSYVSGQFDGRIVSNSNDVIVAEFTIRQSVKR